MSSAQSHQPLVVAGEALVDIVAGPAGVLRAHPGGGPFNVARTVGRLEQPVAFLGRISSDGFGDRLRQALADDGVLLDSIVETDQPTTLAVAELDHRRAARYRFYTEGTSAPGLTTELALARLPETASALHVGTLGLVLEPLATAVEALVRALAGRVLVMVDPNWRPQLVADADAHRRRLHDLLAHTDVVQVSEDDLAWLDGGRSPEAAAESLLELGPSVVLLTRGERGATVVSRSGTVAVQAPPVQVVDTIGAGDAFGGAFLAWWRRERLTRDDVESLDAVLAAVRFAVIVAARTCERAGASPPRLAELDV